MAFEKESMWSRSYENGLKFLSKLLEQIHLKRKDLGLRQTYHEAIFMKKFKQQMLKCCKVLQSWDAVWYWPRPPPSPSKSAPPPPSKSFSLNIWFHEFVRKMVVTVEGDSTSAKWHAVCTVLQLSMLMLNVHCMYANCNVTPH